MNPLSVLKSLMLLTIILCQVSGFAQQPPASKAQPKPKPNASSPSASNAEPKPKPNNAGANAFVCPDPKAKAACDSYQELKKANDPSLRDYFSSSGTKFVCFRQNEDQFFLVSFSQPTYWRKRHYDTELKRMVVDDDATEIGYAYTTTFNNGIQDAKAVPAFSFKGTWRYMGNSMAPFFEGNALFAKTTDDKSQQSTVLGIDEYQFYITDYKYSNNENKTILYGLTIQRSTGRFRESFRMEDEKIPFIDRAGRCLSTTRN